MNRDSYRHHVTRAAAAVRHLGGAVRGGRAFFIYCDRSDASQPSIIACHPPLSEEAMLGCLGDAEVIWEPISQSDEHRAFVGLATDATFENKELAAELTLLAARSLADNSMAPDAVSLPPALPDRPAFFEELDGALGQSGERVVALVADVDHFHRVIAQFGDAGGEHLMTILGRRIRASVATSAFVARLGGDRIGVMLVVDRADDAKEAALQAAADIQATFEDPVCVADEDIFVSASVGVSTGGRDIRAHKLMRDVDLAIAMAKRAGGSTIRVFRAGMDNSPASQLLREREVRLAVGRGEFTPFFQPIVDVATGELRCFEALLRWQNPEEGTLPPSTFMDVLEATGLIDTVGRRVIRESCEQAARWFELSGKLVPVSVNVAPSQLYTPDFCAHIAVCLAECNLPAAGLTLELTESALISDKTATRTILRRLREIGVRVRIDDFGTGYSALAYLHELPVSGIKLDRGWFRGIVASTEQREIVRRIVDLAHHMGLDVVAEGIETQPQLEVAQQLGCNLAQGFWFARALDSERAARYLETGRV